MLGAGRRPIEGSAAMSALPDPASILPTPAHTTPTQASHHTHSGISLNQSINQITRSDNEPIKQSLRTALPLMQWSES